MKSLSIRGGALLGVLLLGSIPLSAQNRTVAVSGVLVSSTGAPLEAGQITLTPSGLQVLTEVDGTFQLTRIAPGTYRLRVIRLGFVPLDTSLVIRLGEGTHLVLALSPRAEELAGITVVGESRGALTRIPGSAAIIGATQLERTLPLSGAEALRNVPGVHIQPEEGLGLRANVGIRGLDPDRSRNVLVLEDGLPVALGPYGEPEMYYTPPIDRMERVEIIKGSGSILFGPQTIGGVVNYVTASPPARTGGRLDVRGAEGGFLTGRLRFGGTFDRTGVQVTGLRRQADNLAGTGLVFRQTDVTGKITITPSDRSAVGVKLSIYDETSNSTYVGLTDSMYRANPRQHPAPDDRLRIRRYAVSISHDMSLGNGQTLRTAAYAYETTRDWQRQDYSYSPNGNALVYRESTGNRNRTFDVAGIEPRWRAAFGWGDLEAGARLHIEGARDQHINGGTATARTGEIRDDEIRRGVAGSLFAQTRLFLTTRLHLTPGVRVEMFGFTRQILRTRVQREVRDAVGTVTQVTRNPEDVDLRSHDAVSEIIPGIGVTWYGGGLTLFGGAHRGFAPPRIKDALIYDDTRIPAGQQPGNPVSLQLEAERSWNMEFGMRSDPVAGVHVEATAFYLDFSNQIIPPSLSAGSAAQATLANQGATRHRGIETTATIDWGALARSPVSVQTTLSHTFGDAVFSRDRRILRAPGDTVNVKGNRLPYAPRHLLSGAVAVQRPDRFSVILGVAYATEQFADNFMTRIASANGRNGVIPAYTVLDLAGWYALPGTGLRLLGTVKNLAGAGYIASRRPEGIKPGLGRVLQVGAEWGF